MTRDEIEGALLRGFGVTFGDASDDTVVLADEAARRVASVLFEHLRRDSADALRSDEAFFSALETAFQLPDDNEPATETESASPEGADVQTPEETPKEWRLKLVETQGFGGLNTIPSDTFRFEAAGENFCIEGQNGSGKSSLANAILFALTGQIHRDQYGLVKASSCEPVVADTGETIAKWPPIAIYPNAWGSDRPDVDVRVKLTFAHDDEECEAERRLYGDPDDLRESHAIAPELQAAGPLIEAGLLMPMRVQHIRMSSDADNQSLIGLIRQLIGLDPLIEVAELATKLGNGAQRFIKFAKDNGIDRRAKTVNELVKDAKSAISTQEIDLEIDIEVDGKNALSEEQKQTLRDAKTRLDQLQAQGFADLRQFAFGGFDTAKPEHQTRVSNSISRLVAAGELLRSGDNTPPILRDLTALSNNVKSEQLDQLEGALSKARHDLEDAKAWAEKQETDTKLRLKAVAAQHFENGSAPICPLCDQPLKEPQHASLLADLKLLTEAAEAAQTRLHDACLRIMENVRRARDRAVPEAFWKVRRFAAKEEFRAHLNKALVEETNISETLPGFRDHADSILHAVIDPVEEFDFGENVPEPEDPPAQVQWALDHLDHVCNAARAWPAEAREHYREAWSRLFPKEDAKDETSLSSEILKLRAKIDAVGPYRTAAEKFSHALTDINDYNSIVERQKRREAIAEALAPLKKLRALVNWTTRETIDDVSDLVEQVHSEIYNSEALLYAKTDIHENRSKQSLSFRGRLGAEQNWTIDAAVLANTSWMRGILWSFVFAIRKHAIIREKTCSFPLVLLDDPQITFDPRNQKGWVDWLGGANGLRKDFPVQMLVTTHGRGFALELHASRSIIMAKIESGKWSGLPAKMVLADFARVRFQEMEEQQSDIAARTLIGDIRVLAETLLKLALFNIDPQWIESKEATLRKIIEDIGVKRQNKEVPFADGDFEHLIKVKERNPRLFELLNEPHHENSETITVRQGRDVYSFWKTHLFPAIHKVWEAYRFLDRTIYVGGGHILMPTNSNHRPIRSTALAAVNPAIVGRVSAYSDGRLASAMRIDAANSGDSINLQSCGSYRLEKDTLSPVAHEGDILLTRLDGRAREKNLVIEDRGDHLIARRWLADPDQSGLAVMSATAANPRETPKAVVSRETGANRFKIVGILFTTSLVAPGTQADAENEATALDAEHVDVSRLVADTEVFEVQGSSAEPIALDRQFLLAKQPSTNHAHSIRELDGRPVIAESSDGGAYFKRLRHIGGGNVALESLDKAGREPLVLLSLDETGGSDYLVRVREVVGVVFDKQ